MTAFALFSVSPRVWGSSLLHPVVAWAARQVLLQSCAAVLLGGLQQLTWLLLTYGLSPSHHKGNYPRYEVTWDQAVSHMSIGYSCPKEQIRANNSRLWHLPVLNCLFHIAGRQWVHPWVLCSLFPSHTRGCTAPLQPWGRLHAHLQVGQPLPCAQCGQSPARPQKCFSDTRWVSTAARLPARTATLIQRTTWKLLSEDAADLSFTVCHLFMSIYSTFLCCVLIFLEHHAVLKYRIKCFNEIWIGFFFH